MSGPGWPFQGAQFRNWLQILGLTQKRAAELLDVRPREMRYYCTGRKYAPAAVRIALQSMVDDALPKERHRV